MIQYQTGSWSCPPHLTAVTSGPRLDPEPSANCCGFAIMLHKANLVWKKLLEHGFILGNRIASLLMGTADCSLLYHRINSDSVLSFKDFWHPGVLSSFGECCNLREVWRLSVLNTELRGCRDTEPVGMMGKLPEQHIPRACQLFACQHVGTALSGSYGPQSAWDAGRPCSGMLWRFLCPAAAKAWSTALLCTPNHCQAH